MSDNRCHEECCKIPVCLEFTNATATEEFKEQMSEIFTEIFENLCNDNRNKNKNKNKK